MLTLASEAEVIGGFILFVLAVLLMVSATLQPVAFPKDGDK